MACSQRYRTTVSYDGTAYRGFQIQRGLETVQGEIERALAQISGQQVRVAGSGRTDAGVHARGQVVTFDLSWRHPVAELERALNAVVAPDIAFRDTRVCDARFHARYSALSRVYVYQFYSSTVRNPLYERFAWRVPPGLDVEAMRAGARCLLGVHDFASLGQPTSGVSTIRRIDRTGFETAPECERLSFTIEGSGFLRGMVRRIVGCLVQVGLGRWSVSHIDELLLQRDIGESAPPAPPHGLILWQVFYEDDEAAEARQVHSSGGVSKSSPNVGTRSTGS